MAIERLAVIGLGRMGLVLAKRLTEVAAVIGYDLSVERQRAAEAAAITTATSLTEAVSTVEAVVLSLPSPAASLAVATALRDYLSPGSLLIETSTVTPADMAGLEALIRPAGLAIIDAAIQGGVGNVAAGDFVFLVGGQPTDIERARPLLAAIAAEVLVLGNLGAGMTAKVVNNAVVHAVMVVLAEAAALGKAHGLALPALYDLLRRETGLLRPLTHRLGERVMTGNYAGGMSTDLARKDSILALQMAMNTGVPLFAIQASHTVYELASQAGLGELDYAAIATLWRQWLGDTTSTTTDAEAARSL